MLMFWHCWDEHSASSTSKVETLSMSTVSKEAQHGRWIGGPPNTSAQSRTRQVSY